MRKILTCILLLNSLICCSAETMKLHVDRHSQQFNVILPANPTTGFAWTIKNYDKGLIKLTKSQYIAPQTKLIGAGGEMRFSFSWLKGVKHPESTTMLFRYARGWEHGGGQLKQVEITFQ